MKKQNSDLATKYATDFRKPSIPWELELAETILWVELQRPNKKTFLAVLRKNVEDLKIKYGVK